jgi:hypothetical protein
LRACSGLHVCGERGQDSKRGEVDDVREVVCREHAPHKRLAQDLEHVTAARRPFIQDEDAVVRPRPGRVGTRAVRAPVRPATRGMRVVSRASARRIVGRMVVSRRASLDVPTPGGPRRRTLGAERRHPLRVNQGLWRSRWSAVNLLSTQEHW